MSYYVVFLLLFPESWHLVGHRKKKHGGAYGYGISIIRELLELSLSRLQRSSTSSMRSTEVDWYCSSPAAVWFVYPCKGVKLKGIDDMASAKGSL